MEVNKDEADKCLKIGAEALRRGDNERAVKFLKKCLRLYPLPGAKALLAQAEAGQRTGQPSTTNQSSASQQRPRRSESTASSTTGADGREYTEEQVRIVQQVLRSKEGGRGAHYRILGIAQNSSESEIKKAYRKLSLKVHPDKNSAPQADDAFKAVGLAYATLSDTQKRTIYDRYGEEDPDNMGGGGMGGGMGQRGGGVHMHGQQVNPEEIFNMFFGGGMAGGGMGGPGVRMHTTGFGPGFQFQGGAPRARRQGGAPRQQQQQRQEAAGPQNPTMGLLFQLLPVIIIMLLSFLKMDDSGAATPMPGENRYFSLTHNPPFVNPLATKLSSVKEIPYFVSDKFMRTYNRDRYQLSQVERMVERAYETYLVNECDSQNRYQKSLQKKAVLEKNPAEREKKKQKADSFTLTRCTELNDLFPHMMKKGGRY